MTDLSPDVIRSWERRYKLVEPARTASGSRLYGEDELARLTLARQATRLGHPIRLVAQLTNEELEALIDRKPMEAGTNADVVARLLDAMRSHNLDEASQILRVSALLLPTRELVLEILAPVLREVGRRWEHGEMAVWQEHFLSNQVINISAPLHLTAPGARVVFATPSFERHGFGIALAALLAAARGVTACNLGVTVPSAEVVAAARQLHVAAVVVGMTREGLPETEAMEYARELDRDLPPDVDVVLGGLAGARVAASLSSARIRGIATLEEFDIRCGQWR